MNSARFQNLNFYQFCLFFSGLEYNEFEIEILHRLVDLNIIYT
jgi:hypothetical protein